MVSPTCASVDAISVAARKPFARHVVFDDDLDAERRVIADGDDQQDQHDARDRLSHPRDDGRVLEARAASAARKRTTGRAATTRRPSRAAATSALRRLWP